MSGAAFPFNPFLSFPFLANPQETLKINVSTRDNDCGRLRIMRHKCDCCNDLRRAMLEINAHKHS